MGLGKEDQEMVNINRDRERYHLHLLSAHSSFPERRTVLREIIVGCTECNKYPRLIYLWN